MEKLVLLFEEFILKAITLTENFLECDLTQEVDFEGFTSNRDRLLQIIDQISRQIDWKLVDAEKRDDLNRQIEYTKLS